MNKTMVSDNLRWLMKKTDTSENELARKTRVPQPTINRILGEQIKSPRHQTIQPIAAFFGISIDELFSKDLKNEIDIEVRKPATSVLIPLLKPNDLQEWINEGVCPQDKIRAYDVGPRAFAMQVQDVKSSKVSKENVIIFDPDESKSSTYLINVEGELAVRDCEVELGKRFFVGGFTPISDNEVEFSVPATAIAQSSISDS